MEGEGESDEETDGYHDVGDHEVEAGSLVSTKYLLHDVGVETAQLSDLRGLGVRDGRQGEVVEAKLGEAQSVLEEGDQQEGAGQ